MTSIKGWPRTCKDVKYVVKPILQLGLAIPDDACWISVVQYSKVPYKGR